MAESFRSGFESVSNTQIESGLSIGLTNSQLIRYVILPQAFTVAIPALGANGIFYIKRNVNCKRCCPCRFNVCN